MLKTYTLYLRGEGLPDAAFEPVLCETQAELLGKVTDVLGRHPACDAIDVYFGDEELFSVRQPRR
jgi:hypothetical protein